MIQIVNAVVPWLKCKLRVNYQDETFFEIFLFFVVDAATVESIFAVLKIAVLVVGMDRDFGKVSAMLFLL